MSLAPPSFQAAILSAPLTSTLAQSLVLLVLVINKLVPASVQ
jgi:hypothetical protein